MNADRLFFKIMNMIEEGEKQQRYFQSGQLAGH